MCTFLVFAQSETVSQTGLQTKYMNADLLNVFARAIKSDVVCGLVFNSLSRRGQAPESSLILKVGQPTEMCECKGSFRASKS